MVKHNNVLANTHQRKHWQLRVKTFLNQAAKKKLRHQRRQEKAACLHPRPLEKLRPQVHGQTIRYNRKLKLGRGFTLLELKQAGLGQQFAASIGIAVDHRRKNISQENLDANVKRLKAYIGKLILYPRNAKLPKKNLVNDTVIDEKIHPIEHKEQILMELKQITRREKPMKLTEEMKKTNVYRILRQEQTNKKWKGKRDKKAKLAETLELKK